MGEPSLIRLCLFQLIILWIHQRRGRYRIVYSDGPNRKFTDQNRGEDKNQVVPHPRDNRAKKVLFRRYMHTYADQTRKFYPPIYLEESFQQCPFGLPTFRSRFVPRGNYKPAFLLHEPQRQEKPLDWTSQSLLKPKCATGDDRYDLPWCDRSSNGNGSSPVGSCNFSSRDLYRGQTLLIANTTFPQPRRFRSKNGPTLCTWMVPALIGYWFP